MTCPCDDCTKPKADLRWLGYLICLICALAQVGAVWLVFAYWVTV